MPRIVRQVLAEYLGSDTTAFPSEEAKTIFIAETKERGAIEVHDQIDVGGSDVGYENQSADRKSD